MSTATISKDSPQPAKAIKHQRPLIIVTGPNKRWRFGWWAARFQLWRLGMRGVYLCPGEEELPDHAQGVIIGGGDDIDPKHYGAQGAAGANYDADRDRLELTVIALAKQWQLPLLGICRGSQLINISEQGNLISDLRPLRKKTPNRNSLFPVKMAHLEPDSQLAKILEQNPVKVNSLHHQAVDKVGEGLSIVAKDEDGFVQAIEGSGERFLFGVQWHPEYLPFRAAQTKLFLALRRAAIDYAKS